MPSMGPPELIVILVLVVIVFGVGKLPEVGGALGKSIKEFRRASEGEDEKPRQDEITREATERREKTL